MLRIPVTVLCGVLTFAPAETRGMDETDVLSPSALFEQTIMPIFKSSHRSSCVQCHLGAVDLKHYLLPSHEKTFVSLRDQGLIDLDEPDKSKILTFIRKGDGDPDRNARLVYENTRRAEERAIALWIRACCADRTLRETTKLTSDDHTRPKRSEAVIRHALKSRVVDSFTRNIWSHRIRCFPCHTPHEFDERNRYEEHHREFGDRMHIFRETPVATLQYLVEQSRTTREGKLPLINLDDPRKSLLVLKPTSEKPKRNDQGKYETPSSVEPVSHIGSLLIDVDDHRYKSFVAWIQDYARVVNDQYTSVEDLPADNWFPTNQFVKIRRGPEDWVEEATAQLFVHAWNDPEQTWESEPIAFTQGQIKTRRKVFTGTLLLLAPKDAEQWEQPDREDATLAPGKYLIKAYLDSKRRLAVDPAVLLNEADFYGQAEIQARWRKGTRDAEVIRNEFLKP